MSKLVNPNVIQHKIAVCPCCRNYLWADVTVAAEVGTPTFTAEGKASVYVNAKVIGMSLPEHSCEVPEESA